MLRTSNRSAGATSWARFLDPATLARIDNLELLAKTVVNGFMNGLHRSPYLGLSLDFAEHRSYMPGDDIRWIDWRLYARTDRFYVKQFEADSNANTSFVIDISKSMSFGTSEVTKLEYAKYLGASLAYFSHRQRDRVGLVTFDDDIVGYVPPSMKHLDTVLHTLATAEAGRPGSYEKPFLKVTENLSRKGIVVVVSDFYADPEEVTGQVAQLAYRGHDVIVFHLLDPAELDFPFEGASTFEDLESGEQIPVVPDNARERYLELIRTHTERLQKLFSEKRVDYNLIDISKPLDFALFRYLAAREKLQRTR